MIFHNFPVSPYCRLITLAMLLCILSACRKNAGDEQLPAVSVSVTSMREMVFRERIRVHGNVEPVQHAEIGARIEGTIDLMNVDEGQRVTMDEILFQIDKANLEREVQISEQNLKVAQASRDRVMIDLDVSKTLLAKAELDYQRAQELISKSAISQDKFERDELLWKQALAVVKQSEANVKHQNALVEQARNNLEIARKELSDSIVCAPFSGVITRRHLEAGEYANRADPVVRLEAVDNLEISMLISARYYPRVIPGKSKTMVYSLEGEKIAEGKISYRAPSIDPESRTYEIKMNVPPESGMVSGMLCNIDIVLQERHGMGVPDEAIVERNHDRKVIFLTAGQEAAEKTISPGIMDSGFTEILNAAKFADAEIIIEGQSFLNDGSRIKINKRKLDTE